MLKIWKLNNFKSVRDSLYVSRSVTDEPANDVLGENRLDLAPLTVPAGPNSSGKSTIVDREKDAVKDFEDLLGDEFAFVQVAWEPKKGTSTRGCQITIPHGKFGGLATLTIEETVSAMSRREWTIEKHRT